ncbi:RHS repeat-associated core domain-containing protein [Pseudochryseolinea flava]|uniref:RHS repeat-associated core domain-containing protein n=1 Tax=Pseudochryseolinea flava TaxID=2059302 RepID=A0A364XY98_9BACT|nr:RHS repeat-associated core domain-containing protein [Pseudochryseolinea flava]RAV99275.1 hypothetical protein DQQ10_20500 [Pseudochryseolinea flava]
MSTAARETGENIAHEHLLDSVTISEAGYVYIYLSNEEGENAYEVYFDEFKVEYTKSPVIQMEDYYPFGLTFNSYQRENKLTNDITFQNQERQDELNLGWVQFKWRNAMPDIGRFFNVDPIAEDYYHNSVYAFSENKLISYRELEGLEAQLIIVGVVVAVTVEEVTLAALISGAVVFGEEIVEGIKEIANTPVSGGVRFASSPVSAWGQEAYAWQQMAKQAESKANSTKTSTGDEKDSKSNGKATGSYTNTHESGKKYHGKGGEDRARQSADRVAKENKDPAKKTEWKPAKNDRQAFKDEAKRIKKDGGVENPNNYNKVNSPGKKYIEEDNKKTN